MPKFDIVSIGDTTIDAFIELHEASVHCAVDHTNCQLCLSYADKVPYDKLTMLPAGNSTNNAVGSARLGMKNAFITAIGDDNNGKLIEQELTREGIDTQFIHVNRGVLTNFHFVLSFQAERTILIKHNKFQYKFPNKLDTDWIYFSSMAAGTEKFHKEVENFLVKNPKVKLAFNPGTFQIRMGTAKLKNIYKRTEILFLNREEAQLVLKENTRNVKTLLKGMRGLGAKIAVLTDGRQGSYALGQSRVWYLDEFEGPHVEATGAGDAFGTAFTAAISLGKPISDAIAWGTVNGGHVVMQVGPHAGLQTKGQIEKYLRAHPKFRAKEI
jgi:sugar/nucleoside kinase (ribokinase family)